ncbi:WecB/TagA/CpsF family glycosyltransferase [Acidisoma sp.]|uniref:WecB/TagA/CpsF family glycosyltransferase n=1 Tax=Acidisoma sp. TaxID=1872115 RepID=UPI003AFFBC69
MPSSTDVAPAPALGRQGVQSRLDVQADRFDVMGLRLHNIHRAAIVDRVVGAVMEQDKLLVVNANAHCVTLSQTEPWLRGLFAEADIAFCDGAGVQVATKILKGFTPHRTTPPEWIGIALERLGSQARVFWLGGTREVAMQAAAAFEARYDVVTAGVQDGYFDASPGSADTREIIARINESRATVLLVNMGMPRQERWLWDNWQELRPVVAITAGALVDHAAGRVSRPPRWIANLGIEWLVRLIREPRRLWRRYLLGLPVFGGYLLGYAIRAKLTKPDGAQSKTSA